MRGVGALAVQNEKLLALDQSSRITGYAVFENGELTDCGKFEFTGEIGSRLVGIKEKIISLVQEHEITKIAFEDIQLQSNIANNVTTYKSLAMVFGVVMETCEEENISQEIVHSQTWKSKLSIKGRSRADQKRAAQQYVLDRYKVKASQDTCDAICIGCSLIDYKDPHDWSN